MPALTDQGLQIDTLDEIIAGLQTAYRAAFGQSFDVSDTSPDGQFIGIYAEIPALLNELLEAIVASQDPDKASGVFLRALCALTGTKEIPASFSTVTLTLTGTPTAVIPANSLASTLSTGQQFGLVADATVVALTAWAGTTAYVVDDRRTNAGNSYLCITAGTSAGSGGPTTTAADITDGTAHWKFLGAGTGAVDASTRATVTGPIVAVAGDIVQIDSPDGGWQGVINLLDATPGRDPMTDAQLRVLRVLELAQPGTSPADAIRAALLEVDRDTGNPVTAATVFVNDTDVIDADGVPPHSIECLVTGGSDQSIFDALLANVAAGIRTHGSVVGAATDSSGTAHTEKFSRPTEIDIWVDVTLVKDPRTYPVDGDDQVKLAIATRGNAKPDGTDVTSAAQLASVFTIAGLLDCDLPLIGTAAVPTLTTTIVVTNRQRAKFDTSRVTVTSSDGTP